MSNLVPLNPLALAIALTSLQALPTLAVAQTNAEQDIEEVVVTGSVLGESTQEELRTYPGNRNIITAEDLKHNAVRSIDDALQRTPGIKIQDETGTGVLPNVATRGLNASRSGYTQFLLDGVPLTLAPYGHTGQSLFPAALKNLDRIDIVRGGAAVQYGPNNVGGVINLVSKPIPEQWQTSLQEVVTVFSGGDALYDTYLSTGGPVSSDFAMQFEGNVITGDSEREHSATDVSNWVLKTRWNIDQDQSLALNLQRYDAETEMPGALYTEAYEQDRQQSLRPNDLFAGDSNRASVRYNRKLTNLGFADAGEFDWVTFGHDSTRNFQWDFTTAPEAEHWADTRAEPTMLRTSPREFLVWGTEPRASFLFTGGGIEQQLIIGARYMAEDIEYKLNQTVLATGVASTPRDWHLDTAAIAAYISDEIALLDGRLTVTPGLRYESVDMTFSDLGNNTETDNTITELLPGVTVGFEASERWFLYTNAQRSLRAPQIANIRGQGEEGAELAWNYEAGVRYGADDTGSIAAAVYQIDFVDQLLYNSTEQSFDNIGETRHQGLELEGNYSPSMLPQLQLHLAYNYLDSEQRKEGPNQGNELPYVSEHQLIWDATWEADDYYAALSGFYFSSAFSDATNTIDENSAGTAGELPSYTIWNIKVGKEWSPMFSTGLAVNNLFDEQYYFRGIDVSPAGRYPAPGRSVSLDLELLF